MNMPLGLDRSGLDHNTFRLRSAVKFLKSAANFRTLGIELKGTSYFASVAHETLSAITQHLEEAGKGVKSTPRELHLAIDVLAHGTFSPGDEATASGILAEQAAKKIETHVDTVLSREELDKTSTRLLPFSRFNKSLTDTWEDAVDTGLRQRYGYDDRLVTSQVKRAPSATIAAVVLDSTSNKPISNPNTYAGLETGFTGPQGIHRGNHIKKVRGDDSPYRLDQGYIYLETILENRKSVTCLATVASSCQMVIGLERGGGLLTDLIEHTMFTQGDTNTECVKLPKTDRGAMQVHLEKMTELAISKFGDHCTLGFSETVVGGSSAITLLKTLSKLAKAYPNVTFKALLHRQTMNRDPNLVTYGRGTVVRPYESDDDEKNDATSTTNSKLTSRSTQRFLVHEEAGKPFSIPDENEIHLQKNVRQPNIEIHIAPTRYLLGEDVGYQLSPYAQHPLVIFEGAPKGDTLKAVTVQPSDRSSSRAELVRVICGDYDGTIGKTLTPLS